MSEIKCEKCEVIITEENCSRKITDSDYDYYCNDCWHPSECKRCGKILMPPGIHTCTPKANYARD